MNLLINNKLNASVSVFLMERDEWPRYRIILEKVAVELDGLN